MITFYTVVGADNNSLVSQTLTRPAVYLDTWAIRLFAETNIQLGERFREALKRAGGSLMLSHMSFSEFTFDDPRHGKAAGRYLNSLFPNLFFSHSDPFEVIKAEIPVMVGQTKESPAGEPKMLAIYADAAVSRGYPSISAWFTLMHQNRVAIRGERDSFAQVFLNGVTALRNSGTESEKWALRDIKNSTRPRATQALIRALLYRMRRDRVALKPNDAIDLLHSIVPIAYCDFVLLDRAWSARVEDAIKFLRRCHIETRIAQRVTQRAWGVLRFVEGLEAWPNTGGRNRG